jgi:hypothetical protein
MKQGMTRWRSAHADAVVQQGDVTIQYPYSVGPGGGDNPRAVAFIVGRYNGGHSWSGRRHSNGEWEE